MKRLLTVFLPLLAFACLFTACSDDDDPQAVVSRYDLPVSFGLKSVNDEEAIIVRTNEEFNELFAEKNFVTSYEKVTLPPIDFSRYDLFYVQGKTTSAVSDFHADMITDGYPYRLWVYVMTSMSQSLDEWCVGYLVPKSDWNDQVQLEMVINGKTQVKTCK